MTQSTSEFIATRDVVSHKHLQTILDCEVTDTCPIQVCAGEWRIVQEEVDLFGPQAYTGMWRFWKDPDWSDEDVQA